MEPGKQFFESENSKDILLTKYVTNEANSDERKIVEDWLSVNEVNRHELDELGRILKAGDMVASPSISDENKVWLGLQAQITADAARPRRIWYADKKVQWASLAAVLLTIAFIWKIFSDSPSRSSVSVTLNIKTLTKTLTDTLPDGSIVTLYPNSSLSYPKTFTTENRNVSMEGNVFFNISHDASRPFIIQVSDMAVTVLGTSFTIKSTKQLTQITVATGRVQVTRKNKKIELTAGEKLSVIPADTSLERQQDTIVRAPAKIVAPDTDTAVAQFEFSDDLRKQQIAMRNMIREILRQKLAANAEGIDEVVLNQDRFIINGEPQPKAVHRRFLSRFPCPAGLGYYYGNVKQPGKGIFIDKKDIIPYNKSND